MKGRRVPKSAFAVGQYLHSSMHSSGTIRLRLGNGLSVFP